MQATCFEMPDDTMLLLDGGKYSGSGAIVRFGVALAALTGQELRLTNIRARRDHPGLRPQHVTAVQAVGSLCCGSLDLATVGSRELVFSPGPLSQGGMFQWNIGTAGSTTMLALSLLPIAAFAAQPCTFRLTGSLFQDFAPSAFHFQHTLLPLLGRMGLKAELRMLQPGYVPKGSGTVELWVEPVHGALRPMVLLEWGSLRRLWGIALSSHLQQRQVSHRMAERCQQTLDRRGLKADMDIVYDEAAIQPGACLALFAESTSGAILGSDQAGAIGRRAESIGEFVARTMLEGQHVRIRGVNYIRN